MSALIERAKPFAFMAHKGQTRRNKDNEPFSLHLEEVATLVELSGGSEEEIAAGWLHDIVEDTKTRLMQVAEMFGLAVAEIVDGLTDPPEFSGMPLHERKVIQAKRVRAKSDKVKRVKIADQTSNVRSLIDRYPVTWNSDKCLEYAEGAFLVAMECGNISDFLNAEFRRAYNGVLRAHMHDRWISPPIPTDALADAVRRFFAANIHRGFTVPFQLASIDHSPFNPQILYVVPQDLEEEDIDNPDTEWDRKLGNLGARYGVRLALPHWAYEK